MILTSESDQEHPSRWCPRTSTALLPNSNIHNDGMDYDLITNPRALLTRCSKLSCILEPDFAQMAQERGTQMEAAQYREGGSRSFCLHSQCQQSETRVALGGQVSGIFEVEEVKKNAKTFLPR